MANLVVDSNVWVAAFLSNDRYHSQATQFLAQFQSGAYHCHLPYLVLAETCASIARQVQVNGMAYVLRVRWSFENWTHRGMITWYDVNQSRTYSAMDFNLQLLLPLKGSDSIIAYLSQELGCTLRTFDTEILDRYFRATI